jgi:hypothetical protein
VTTRHTLNGELITDLLPAKRRQFKEYVENRYIHLSPGESKDDFFARYDEALDAVDRNFRIRNGIFFTDLDLSKFVMWFVKRDLPDLGKNYLVIDPACGSGNLVTKIAHTPTVMGNCATDISRSVPPRGNRYVSNIMAIAVSTPRRSLLFQFIGRPRKRGLDYRKRSDCITFGQGSRFTGRVIAASSNRLSLVSGWECRDRRLSRAYSRLVQRGKGRDGEAGRQEPPISRSQQGNRSRTANQVESSSYSTNNLTRHIEEVVDLLLPI